MSGKTVEQVDPADRVNALVSKHGTSEAGLWRAVLERALHDPVLHSVVTRYERGDMSREASLSLAALLLSFMYAEKTAELIARLASEPLVRASLEQLGLQVRAREPIAKTPGDAMRFIAQAFVRSVDYTQMPTGTEVRVNGELLFVSQDDAAVADVVEFAREEVRRTPAWRRR